MSVAPYIYNKILNNIAQNSVENAEKSIDKPSRTLISMCRSDDDNNYPENWKSDVKNAIPGAVTIDEVWKKQDGFNLLLGVAFIISFDTGVAAVATVKLLLLSLMSKKL